MGVAGAEARSVVLHRERKALSFKERLPGAENGLFCVHKHAIEVKDDSLGQAYGGMRLPIYDLGNVRAVARGCGAHAEWNF